MAQLALVAMVLLATVPTLGRIVAGRTATAAPAPTGLRGSMMAPGDPLHRHGAMHAHVGGHDDLPMHAMSAHGMAMDHGAMHHAHPAARSTSVLASHRDHAGQESHAGHEGDCDYCPLLHSLLGALGIALLSIPRDALPPPREHRIAATLSWHYPAGLGSRGPPATL